MIKQKELLNVCKPIIIVISVNNVSGFTFITITIIIIIIMTIVIKVTPETFNNKK